MEATTDLFTAIRKVRSLLRSRPIISKHAKLRMLERGISLKEVKETILNGLAAGGDRGFRFTSWDSRHPCSGVVVISTEQGVIKTVWRRS